MLQYYASYAYVPLTPLCPPLPRLCHAVGPNVLDTYLISDTVLAGESNITRSGGKPTCRACCSSPSEAACSHTQCGHGTSQV
jgi:hypothetical protein